MFCKVQDKGATLADITNAVKDLPFVSDKSAFLKEKNKNKN